MRRFLTIVFVLLCANASFAQETYFYKLSGIVFNGQKRAPDTESHLFVTFSKDICYDSDKEGFYAGYGTLRRTAENEQSVQYSGNCFFGAAQYIVSKNRDLINIWCPDGKVYVYTRNYPSSTITKSYYGNIVCRYESKTYTPPTTPNSNANIIIDNSNNNSQSYKEDRKCPSCHGTGKCTHCAGRGWKRRTYDGVVDDCVGCDGTGRCGVCHGKGYIL